MIPRDLRQSGVDRQSLREPPRPRIGGHLMLRLAALLLLTVLPALAHAQGEQQTLVDRATLTVEEMLGQPPDQQRTSTLRQSKAVMICPRIFRAGFFFGGAWERGSCGAAASGIGTFWVLP